MTTSTCDSNERLKLYSALQMMQDCSEMWLEQTAPTGTINEIDVWTRGKQERAKSNLYRGDSFAMICGYREHGMGSNILDHAEIGEGAIVAAGSVVLGGTKIGPHELWAGSPAKFKKMVDPAQAKEINVKIAKNYLIYSTWYDPQD